MNGGAGNDIFRFLPNNGDDFIGGFDLNSNDIIDLSGIDGLSYTTFTLKNLNGDVVIDFGSGTLTLWNTSTSDVTEDDFIF